MKPPQNALDHEPTAPDSPEAKLHVVERDGLDDDERAKLHEALRQSIAEADAGMLIDADELLRELGVLS